IPHTIGLITGDTTIFLLGSKLLRVPPENDQAPGYFPRNGCRPIESPWQVREFGCLELCLRMLQLLTATKYSSLFADLHNECLSAAARSFMAAIPHSRQHC